MNRAFKCGTLYWISQIVIINLICLTTHDSFNPNHVMSHGPYITKNGGTYIAVSIGFSYLQSSLPLKIASLKLKKFQWKKLLG